MIGIGTNKQTSWFRTNICSSRLSFVMTYMTVCECCVLEVVHEWDEEAGDEARQREQNRPHSEAGEREPDEGPVPVQAAVRPLEHPG